MKYVSINGHHIRSNARALKAGSLAMKAPIRVARSRNDKHPSYAFSVEIIGNSKLMYNPLEPILNCGARLVLVADDVRIVA